MSSTCILIKPDAFLKKELILNRLEDVLVGLGCGFSLDTRIVKPTLEMAESHYEEHKGKDFFPALCEFLSSGDLLAVRVASDETKELVPFIRSVLGAVGQAGTLRGDFGVSTMHNAIHASDSQESAQRELTLWFRDNNREVPADDGGVEETFRKLASIQTVRVVKDIPGRDLIVEAEVLGYTVIIKKQDFPGASQGELCIFF